MNELHAIWPNMLIKDYFGQVLDKCDKAGIHGNTCQEILHV